MGNKPSSFWLCNFIDRISRPSVLIVLMLIYLAFPLYLFPVAAGGFEHLPLDLMFAYTPTEAYAQLAAFGPTGREDYMFGTTVIDVAYAVTYSFMFSVWLTLLLRGHSRYLCILSMLPFAIFVIDMMENTGIALMLANYPEQIFPLAYATSTATTCKWLIAGPLILFTLGLSLWRIGRFLLFPR